MKAKEIGVKGNDYPDYYYRIIALLKNNGLPLQKSYYFSSSETSETDFTTQLNQLKNFPYTSESIVNPQHQFSKDIVKVTFERKIKKLLQTSNSENLRFTNERVQDIIFFEKKLAHVVNEKFAGYSKEYLYCRDIQNIAHKKAVIQPPLHKNQYYLELDKTAVTIESKYDWTTIYPDSLSLRAIDTIPDYESSAAFTVVLPELDNCGYSLTNIDSLDLFIMDILSKPKKLIDVLLEAREAFNASELKDSEAEFAKLIIGRVKKALNSKIMKVVLTSVPQH